MTLNFPPGRIPHMVAWLLVVCLPVSSALAQGTGLTRYGPRLGFSLEPDQITFGFFADLGELSPDLHVRPGADLGVGGDRFSLGVNGDLLYEFPGARFPVVPYVGGGIGYVFYDLDVDAPRAAGSDDTRHEIGLNLVFGVEKDLGGYQSGAVEIRFGIDELPDFKGTVALGFF